MHCICVLDLNKAERTEHTGAPAAVALNFEGPLYRTAGNSQDCSPRRWPYGQKRNLVLTTHLWFPLGNYGNASGV